MPRYNCISLRDFFLFHLFCSGIRYRCVFCVGSFWRLRATSIQILNPRLEPKTKLRHKQEHATCHECTSLFYQFGGIEFAKIVCLKSFDRTRHVPIKKWKVLACRQDNGDWIQILASWLFVLFSRENVVCLSENGFGYCDFFTGATHAIQAFKFGAPIFISLTTPTTTQIRQNRHINKIFP